MVNKSAGIIIKNKSVLYVRKRNLLFWILPGGKIKKGESEVQSLERELMEELSSRVKVLNKIGIIDANGFNKSLDKMERIKLNLYRARLLDKSKISSEIIDKAYIKYKNMHRYLLTPVGIKTLQFLHKKGFID